MNRAYPHTRRQALARTRFFALAFAAVLVGCGGRATDGGGASGQGKEAGRGDGMVAAAKVASCAGYTTEVAAQVLNVPAAEIEEKSQDLYEKLRSCSFVSSQDATRRVEFSLRRDDSVEKATDEMDVFRSHLGTGQGPWPTSPARRRRARPTKRYPVWATRPCGRRSTVPSTYAWETCPSRSPCPMIARRNGGSPSGSSRDCADAAHLDPLACAGSLGPKERETAEEHQSPKSSARFRATKPESLSPLRRIEAAPS